MSNSSDESGGHGIEDEDLPADLRPGEDNPLAGGLDDGETAGGLDPGELLQEGKSPDQDDEDNDAERSDGDEGSDYHGGAGDSGDSGDSDSGGHIDS
jgi:hypothetical protein